MNCPQTTYHYSVDNSNSCRTEKIEQSRKRDERIKASAAVPQSEDRVAEPLMIPGITYREINFTGSAYSRSLTKNLSWYDFFKLIILMLFGYRMQAIAVLAPILEAKGLEGLATDSMDICTAQVKEWFDILADPSNYPVMVHCTQGKDRTGLTVMLVLFMLGIPTKVIDADYMLSDSELFIDGEKRIKEINKIGLSKKFGRCSPELVRTVERHIEEIYGSIEGYLDHAGVSQEVRRKVEEMLLN
jgi:protein-tyrosine phosphatase